MSLGSTQPWTALLDRLGRDFPVAQSAPDWLCLEWPDTRQTVQINCLVVQGLTRLVVSADICRATQFSPERALRLGAQLLTGGLVLRHDILALRHIFSDGKMGPGEPDETILALRDNALALRARILETHCYFPGGLD